MSQAIVEIRHFRKSLGISRNAQAIEEFPQLSRQLQKHKAFPEMPRQLGKFEFRLSTAQYVQPVKCEMSYKSKTLQSVSWIWAS